VVFLFIEVKKRSRFFFSGRGEFFFLLSFFSTEIFYTFADLFGEREDSSVWKVLKILILPM